MAILDSGTRLLLCSVRAECAVSFHGDAMAHAVARGEWMMIRGEANRFRSLGILGNSRLRLGYVPV